MTHVQNIYPVGPHFKVDFIRIFLDDLDANTRIRGAARAQWKLCNLGNGIGDRIDDVAGRARIASGEVLMN
jgi:hypothetical protein